VLDDAADVVQGQVGQAGVLVTREQVLAVLPQRLVYVHAGAVVADERLGHEGRRLAVGVGHVVDHVLHLHGLVGAAHQGVELGADLALAGRGDLVWCTSTSTPISSSARHMAARMSLRLSTGGTGK